MDKTKTPHIGDIVIYKTVEQQDGSLNNNWAKELPAIVTCVWSDECVNLKVFSDGPYDEWRTSVLRGANPGQWDWLTQ